MKRNKVLCISLLLVAFYAVLVGIFHLPPYSILQSGYTKLIECVHTRIHAPDKAQEQKAFNLIPKEYTETDVAGIISIRQVDDVSQRRAELISFLWGTPGLPLSLPSAIIKNQEDTRYEDIQSLGRIDKVVVAMEFGLESTAYHFVPKNPNNRVVLYHQGHNGDFIHGKKQIRQLIENGYAVMAFSMPLLGHNTQPTIDFPRIGKVKMVKHNDMKFLNLQEGHAVKYFIEPLVVAMNYLKNNFDYTQISMIGLSGGGWTTTLAAAVDTRIRYSFPVAGSYPMYLRSNALRDWGDFEQTAPGLYRTVNNLELYILGGYGKGRKQLQIINKYDACCFAGIKWQTYKDIVRARVHQLGAGEFDLFMDDSHRKHIISSIVMDRILDEMGKD